MTKKIDKSGKVVTFYSYKGGVGRSMALANIAVLLAKWNYKVLIIDWDLEAPGLENFYKKYFQDDNEKIAFDDSERKKNSKKYIFNADVENKNGLIDILLHDSKLKDANSNFWKECLMQVDFGNFSLDFISAGKRDENYVQNVISFDFKNFYENSDGGKIIENLRKSWKNEYDFVLVDSRTGVSDIGGVCTIQLPDILVLFFTATEQGFNGTLKVAESAIKNQRLLHFDRINLLILPIPTRIEVTDSISADKWYNLFEKGLQEIYAPWLPEAISRNDFLVSTKIPYVGANSYGERLPVVEENIKDPARMGYPYEAISALIANKLNNPDLLIRNRTQLIDLALNPVESEALDNAKINNVIDLFKKDRKEDGIFELRLLMNTFPENKELIELEQNLLPDITKNESQKHIDLSNIKRLNEDSGILKPSDIIENSKNDKNKILKNRFLYIVVFIFILLVAILSTYLITNKLSKTEKTNYTPTITAYPPSADSVRSQINEVATVLLKKELNKDNSDVDSVIRYINDGADANTTDDSGWSALHLAAWHNNTLLANKLIQKNSNINAMNNRGTTPLWDASKHNSLNVARLLLDQKGINPNIIVDGVETVLEVAASDSMKKLLKSAGAKVIDDVKPSFIITYDQLQQIMPKQTAPADMKKFLAQLNIYATKYNITTPKRMAAFLAIIAPETDLSYLEEKKISNDNIYHGRGLFAFSGRENYKILTMLLSYCPDHPDLIRHPELLLQMPVAVKAACAWWQYKLLNNYADADDFNNIVKTLTGGGMQGLETRVKFYNISLNVLKSKGE